MRPRNQLIPELIDASGRGDLAQVLALLDEHADPDGREPETGRTPLMIASMPSPDRSVKWERVKIVETLISQGADPNATDVNSCTALMLAAWDGTSEEVSGDNLHIQVLIATALIEAGTDLDNEDISGKTALDRAHIASNAKISALLEEAEWKVHDRRRSALNDASNPMLLRDVVRSYRFWPGATARVVCLRDSNQVGAFCEQLRRTMTNRGIPAGVEIIPFAGSDENHWLGKIQNSTNSIGVVGMSHRRIGESMAHSSQPNHYFLFFGFGDEGDLEKKQHANRKMFLEREAKRARREADLAMAVLDPAEKDRVQAYLEAQRKVEEAEKQAQEAHAKCQVFSADLKRLAKLKIPTFRIFVRRYTAFDWFLRQLENVPGFGSGLSRRRRQREALLAALQCERSAIIRRLTTPKD